MTLYYISNSSDWGNCLTDAAFVVQGMVPKQACVKIRSKVGKDPMDFDRMSERSTDIVPIFFLKIVFFSR